MLVSTRTKTDKAGLAAASDRSGPTGLSERVKTDRNVPRPVFGAPGAGPVNGDSCRDLSGERFRGCGESLFISVPTFHFSGKCGDFLVRRFDRLTISKIK